MTSSLDQTVPFNLGDVTVDDNSVSRDGARIFVFPTNIAEIARLEDKLFVVLTVPDPRADPNFAGTNLWCVHVDGKFLWKAENLNAQTSGSTNEVRVYSDLRIYDRASPKLELSFSERQHGPLEVATGLFYNDPKAVDWKQPYEAARKQYEDLCEDVNKSSFVASVKLREVSRWVPMLPRTDLPPMALSELSP